MDLHEVTLAAFARLTPKDFQDIEKNEKSSSSLADLTILGDLLARFSARRGPEIQKSFNKKRNSLIVVGADFAGAASSRS